MISHVIDTPIFASSTVAKGLQIADVFAYGLAHQNMGRTELRSYCDRIREMEWRNLSQQEFEPRGGFRFRDVPLIEERIGCSLAADGGVRDQLHSL